MSSLYLLFKLTKASNNGAFAELAEVFAPLIRKETRGVPHRHREDHKQELLIKLWESTQRFKFMPLQLKLERCELLPAECESIKERGHLKRDLRMAERHIVDNR